MSRLSSALYEVVSLGMRYWFVLLGVLIVARTFIWLLKEHRDRHRRLHHLPDAGTVGRLLVLDGAGCLEEGTELVLPYEGTLGSLRTCDVFLPGPEVAGEHLDFSFQPQVGMLLYPRQGMTCVADGEEMDHRSRARQHPLHHGSILEVGGVRLRLRLFEGLEAGGSAVLLPDEEEIPTIPNEGYESTAALPVVPPDEPAPRDPSDSPAVPRRVPVRRVDRNPLPPAQPGKVESRPVQPVQVPAARQEAPKDPYAHTDRLHIVKTYENTDEAGEQQGSRWRSTWRRDDDA